MVGFIYKYENKINHKVYIGQTTDLVNRKSSHRYKSTFVKSKFYNAVRKYGWDNFDFDIIAQVEEESLDKLCEVLDSLEIKFITEYNSFYEGYNSTTGGHCYRGKEVSEEFREYCRNRTYSEETRRKMREAALNRPVSEETRQKLRESAIRNGIGKYADLNREKINASLKKKLSKPVLQIDEDGRIVNEFPSVSEAAEYIRTKLAPGKTLIGMMNGIHQHCVGKNKSRLYYGFEWKFRVFV